MDDNKQKMLQTVGAVLFIAANVILNLSGVSPEKQYRILSELCEAYLISHTDYDVPPYNCETELTYLQKRIARTLKELKNARDNPDLSVPDYDEPIENSNS